MARWCEAGKNHIWLRHDGSAQLCCSCLTPRAQPPKTHKFSIKEYNNNLLNLINSENFQNRYKELEYGPLIDGSCQICVNKELKGEISQRQKINKLTNNGKKFFLKVDFSNKCNLKCVMCNSNRSTNWIKDEQKLVEFNKKYNYTQTSINDYSSLELEWLHDIDVNWWKNLEELEISGGEPFYQTEVLTFLNFVSQYNTNLKLRIITNASILNNEILEIIKKYKKLYLFCSVDAWQDDVYSYVRYGISDLKTVKENIKILYEFSTILNVVDVIHPYNYDQKKYALEWIEKQNFKNNFSYEQNSLYWPSHLVNDSVLPNKWWPHGNKNKELQLKFARWTLELDKIRKTNIFDIRPEFELWFKELGVI